MKGEHTKNSIIDGVFWLTAQYGLENLTTKKLADHCGVAEGTLYRYFENKEEMLKECYFTVNREIDEALSRCATEGADSNAVVRGMWDRYLDYMVEHPDRMRFYDQYRHSSYMARVTIQEVESSFSFLTQYIVTVLIPSGIPLTRQNSLVFWGIVIETAIAMAKQADKETLTPAIREQTFRMLSRALLRA